MDTSPLNQLVYIGLTLAALVTGIRAGMTLYNYYLTGPVKPTFMEALPAWKLVVLAVLLMAAGDLFR